MTIIDTEPGPPLADRITRVLDAVRAERERQERKHGPHTCAAPAMPDVHRLAVLAEEFGEVARLVCEWSVPPKKLGSALAARYRLRDELVHVAAVAAAWAEGLDSEARRARS